MKIADDEIVEVGETKEKGCCGMKLNWKEPEPMPKGKLNFEKLRYRD